MSNCLIDWIGIYGCDAPAVFSDVYINQLPGIDLESIASVADDEQETYLGVWADVQLRGTKKFYNRLNSELQKKYRLKSLRSTLDLGNIVTPASTTAPTNQYRGFTYEMKLLNQYRRSNFQLLSVQKLKLYLIAAGAVTVKIIDLDTGEVLFTQSVTGVAGWNTIQVNENYASQRILFCYDDANTITAPDFEILNSNSDWFNTMYQSFYGYGCCNVALNGAVTTDRSQVGNQEVVEYSTGTNTFGLSAVFSLVCSYDFLICNNKDLFTTALWYLLGSELMVEILASGKLNKWTTIDRDKAETLRQAFLTEFQNELTIALDGVTLNTLDACIDCNRIVEVYESVV